MWYDVLVVGVLLYAIARGAMKGMVWQLATIAALVLCFAFSETLSQGIAPYIAVSPPLNRWLAMFALYVVFSFLSFAAARTLKNWIDKAQFVEYDRHLGSIFGFVKGVLFVLVMTFFSVTLTQHQFPQVQAAVFDSYTGKMSAVIMDRLHPVMPKELHDVLAPYIHQLDRPELNLQHAHDHDHDHKTNPADHEHDHAEHGHDDEAREPFPPFPVSPRRAEDEPPPFDSVSEMRDDLRTIPSVPDFFDLPFPLPRPSEPTQTPMRPSQESPVEPRPLPERNSLRAERVKLLKEAAGVLADTPDAQATIVEEMEKSLTGLPDQIKFQVVQDWYTDLLIYDPQADPDAETDLSTLFDERIRRQLRANNVPLSSLSAALQDRLEKSRR